jgi:putative acetyltransferase
MLQPLFKTLAKGVRIPLSEAEAIRYRRYRRSDLDDILTLFYDTVHGVCANDYTPGQLRAWAPEELNKHAWAKSLRKNICYVAELQNRIIGFGDLFYKGNEINRLYTHKDFQGFGVATRILEILEIEVLRFGFDEMILESSLTAKGFYESQGFECRDIVKKCIEGEEFYNYFMIKKLLD